MREPHFVYDYPKTTGVLFGLVLFALLLVAGVL